MIPPYNKPARNKQVNIELGNANATGMGVIICPGGGYGVLAYDWEGADIAKLLNSRGIAAFVLKYRLPQSQSVIVSHKAPIQDAIRAMQFVRFNAEKWNVDLNKIGVVGFSAGGHLASTLGTHFNDRLQNTNDEIDKLNARPDFMALIYPVISMKDGITHSGSRNNLLGKSPSKELVEYYSNELQVTKETPPTFLIHSSNDKVVPVENSILMYQALLQENIPTEMHIFPEGGHGYSLAINKNYINAWPELFITWLNNLDLN